jgi:hypothetical protein
MKENRCFQVEFAQIGDHNSMWLQKNENTFPHEVKTCESQREELTRLPNAFLLLKKIGIMGCLETLEQSLKNKNLS